LARPLSLYNSTRVGQIIKKQCVKWTRSRDNPLTDQSAAPKMARHFQKMSFQKQEDFFDMLKNSKIVERSPKLRKNIKIAIAITKNINAKRKQCFFTVVQGIF